jgi:glycosyltransferase involved in cell wall biosynthesis
VVTETYPPEINGVALTLARLVEGLCQRGHAVSVVRPRQQSIDRRRAQDAQVMLVPGVALPGYQGLRFGLPAGRVLRQRWTAHRPDVVYVATEGPLGWSAMRTARRLGIPVCSGFHTNFHTYSRHYRVGWLRPLILRYLRAFHNRTTGTFVAGRDLCERLKAAGFTNVRVLGRGVDGRLFSPTRRSTALRRSWGVAPDALVILSVGRVAPEKNLAVAIEAYRALQHIVRAVKFVVVGDGPLRATLERDHLDITFCGVQRGEELARHYASADLFLFPSETETFGNVTLEAMASGLPVVAYDYAAAATHIMHGETGLLVAYGDRPAYVRAVCDLARDPQSLRRIGKQAHAYAASVDWPTVVERFGSLLADAGGRRRAATSDVTAEAVEATAGC